MYYFNPKTFNVALARGSSQDIRVPTLAMLFVAPALGALLVLTLPALGIVLIALELWKRSCDLLWRPALEKVTH